MKQISVMSKKATSAQSIYLVIDPSKLFDLWFEYYK